MSSITLSNCEVVTPGDVTFDEEQKTFVGQSGDPVKGVIVISHTGLLGDVTGDGEVDVTDVVAIANFVMGSIPEGFIEANADMNGQDGVDITDVVALANLVMGK